MARDLTNRANQQVGIDQRVWVITETGGFGAAATGGLIPTATDAIEHVSAKVEFKIPRDDAAHRSGRSKVTRLSGKKEVKWSYEGYITPSDPDGSNHPTLPDAHPMLLSAFGSVDETSPTAKTYKLARSGAYSFRMLEEGTHFSRLATGCVADTLTFTLPGDGKAMMKMEGFGQDAFMSGESTLAQAITGSAVAAAKVIADLTYTAATTGHNGNLISIAYTAGATAGAEVVTVSGNAISIQISTGVSTATQVRTAVMASGAATALVSVAVTGTGSNTQVTTAAGYLTGGLGANDAKVASGQGGRFEAGGYIDILDEDGTTVKNSARLIVSIGTAQNSDIITVSGAALSAADSADIIVGSAPDFIATSSSNALLGLKGSFSSTTTGTLDCDLLSAEISIKNNYSPRANSYGKSSIAGFISDKRREVMVKLDILLTKDNFDFYMANKRFTAENVVIVLQPQDIPAPAVSDATGRTFTFTMPKVEFNIPNVEQPGDGYIKISLEGTALSTDINTANAEMTLAIT